MIETRTQKTISKILLYTLYVVVFVWVISNDIITVKDSPGYLDMHINRSAVYPLFLWILKNSTGTLFAFATVFLQMSLGIIAVETLRKSIQTTLKSHWFFTIVLSAILLIPYVYNQRVANHFLSEAIAYPLYLLVISRGILGMATKQRKYFYQLLPLYLVLLLTRSQFLFLFPVLLVTIIIISYTARRFKKYALITVLLVCVPLAYTILDKTYHKAVHGHFVSTPWTGIHLMAPGLFLSHPEDVAIFSNENDKAFFAKLNDTLRKRKLNIHTLPKGKEPITVFIEEYAAIPNGTIYNVGKELVPYTTLNEQYIQLDAITKRLALPLITQNFKAYMVLFIQNFTYPFGSSKVLLLWLLTLGFSLYLYVVYKSNTFLIITFLQTALFCNVAIVAIGMYTIKRFMFYNDWIVFLLLFVLFDYAWKYIKMTTKT